MPALLGGVWKVTLSPKKKKLTSAVKVPPHVPVEQNKLAFDTTAVSSCFCWRSTQCNNRTASPLARPSVAPLKLTARPETRARDGHVPLLNTVL